MPLSYSEPLVFAEESGPRPTCCRHGGRHSGGASPLISCSCKNKRMCSFCQRASLLLGMTPYSSAMTCVRPYEARHVVTAVLCLIQPTYNSIINYQPRVPILLKINLAFEFRTPIFGHNGRSQSRMPCNLTSLYIVCFTRPY